MADLSMPRRQFLRASALGLGGLALKAGCGSGPPGQNPPNYIFLLTDDQRWDALGCAGNPIIQTPNMDRMAEDGVRFSRAFATTPICAAGRASVFTGLYERTHGYTFTKPPIRREFSDISYPALLRRAGLISATRGAHGGYVLCRAPDAITMEAVVHALEGEIAPMDCFSAAENRRVSCAYETDHQACATNWLWSQVLTAVNDTLTGITLATLVEFAARQVQGRLGDSSDGLVLSSTL